MKIPSLPKDANAYKPWINSVISAVTATAYDEDDALLWIARVTQDNVTFDELGSAGHERSLDAKLRTGLMKFTNGDHSGRLKELIDSILSKAEEQMQATPPRQIKGRQILFLIREFFQVNAGKRVTFELRSLIEINYWGDANLAAWKAKWDDMVRNLRSPLSAEQLEEIYITKLRTSDALRAAVEHYDRLDDDHADRSYGFLSGITDKMIRDIRHRHNTDALVSGGKGNPVKKTAAPGTLPHDGSAGQTPKGKGKDGKGKGKDGKGNGQDGKGEGKDSSGDKPKRPCFKHFFAACTSGLADGKCCSNGLHKPIPSNKDKDDQIFKTLSERYGEWQQGKFKYSVDAAPANRAAKRAGNTPPASPRALAAVAAEDE